MTLMEVLKSGKWYLNLRIANGKRWMVWDDGVWIVYGPEITQRRNGILISTKDEELAVRYLLYKDW